jgi:hypothetical protein
MKTISQIFAGTQALLAISYDHKRCFEAYLISYRSIEEQRPTLIIDEFIRSHGQIPIIEPNKQKRP